MSIKLKHRKKIVECPTAADALEIAKHLIGKGYCNVSIRHEAAGRYIITYY